MYHLIKAYDCIKKYYDYNVNELVFKAVILNKVQCFITWAGRSQS